MAIVCFVSLAWNFNIHAEYAYNPLEEQQIRIYSGLKRGRFVVGLRAQVPMDDSFVFECDLSSRGLAIGGRLNNVGYERKVLGFSRESKNLVYKNRLYVDMYQN